MLISSSDLINLPVYTSNGRHLGRIASFDLNIDGQTIENYYVKTGLIKGLWHEQLMINHRQVISISKEKMVVEDMVLKESEAEFKPVRLATPTAK
ncbi:MAG: hypothetical protein A2729_01750 [Candidatus Buchananbacteria bacterium RIFCSPHIGHO2_01_FULL_39_14]|uniref:PRC-barrel domain-containing protein n=2 Tax=Candidatus Buchananiibacteriota TaxID=1817903 RepID=A0A1G1YP88_9BACT|nr:MAG: hypothetical protein A2729_01750 [Candidatus Buchananbacteria bacterium RIFCSPHIGHO2_01_FULL_39_14]OGY48825.1 MAG: hypothetical protein A3D39_03420 [Candidatus Buchananbacteria bacterium RIFCSPHIGHO2_02_FULL_39_17]OGY54111.1 MAG: hypothetical protein A2912_01945 [Candidatus Buchananbacteria bacterium RIFCSPLOWO2_01_FULL_40_23b]